MDHAALETCNKNNETIVAFFNRQTLDAPELKPWHGVTDATPVEDVADVA